MQYGAKVIDRPENLSGDLEPTVSALKHVLESIEEEVENIILLQATNPLRPENLLKEALKSIKKEITIVCSPFPEITKNWVKLLTTSFFRSTMPSDNEARI